MASTVTSDTDNKTIEAMEGQFTSFDTARLSAMMDRITENQAAEAGETKFRSSDSSRLNALIDKLKTGLRRINNLRVTAGNPELAKLAANYSILLSQANGLLDRPDSGASVEMLSGELSILEGQFDKCLHDAQRIAGESLPDDQAAISISPDQYWQPYFIDLSMMMDELVLLRTGNRQIASDLRAIQRGHRHFTLTMMMAAILSETGSPVELKIETVEKMLSKEQAEMEAEVRMEEEAMHLDGVPEEDIAVYHARFRTFMNNRLGNMRVSAHAIAERMQLGYGHAKPVIARMYGDYVAEPMHRFNEHYPVYRENVNTFMHQHAAATRHMGNEFWTHGTAGMQTLATQLGNSAGRIHAAIDNARNLREAISATDAVNMQQTLTGLLEQNYADGVSIDQTLTALQNQKQLVADLLSGAKNDPASIKQAAGFLYMDDKMLVKQINAYRNAHAIPEIKISWRDRITGQQDSGIAQLPI